MPHQTSGPPRPPGRCLLTGPRARHARRAGRLHPGPPWGSSPLAAVAYYAEIHSGRTSVPAPGTCAGGRSPPGRRGRAPEMPPGKVLQPVLKMKVDELFMCWLSESSTQAVLQDCLQRIKMPGGPEGGGGDSGQPGPPFAAPALACRPRGLDSPGAPSPSSASTALPLGAASSARSGPPVRGPRRSAGTRVVQTRKEQPLPPAASLSIPTFYFPRGRPQDTVNVDASIAKIERTFAQFPHERATMGDMGRVAKDVVNTHPGLAFLKEASEFHSRYITTVIQRIFYTVNRSWSGRITCAELRRSTFLQNVALLEDEVDINQLTEFFSYEHFYVIYCKFWELDTDHDLLIDAQDLARHNDHAISTKMIDRIFSGAVTRGKKVQKEGKISYADFVWFLISEEDKKTPTSIEYWFRCMDLDGDGVLSMFELEYFYEEQCRRLDSMAIEALPFEDCLCQMLDLVKPQSEGRITLHDLKRCKLASVFFDTFFNIEKYLDHEQREQISLFRDSESEGPELSDWERYAAEEYDILVAEEAVGEPWEDGYEAELSPVDQKLSALRSPLAQRPFFEVPTGLGAVELYEYERGGDDLPPS
ncbi:serine/threonine-protein phosphatase 2A regulatory subunit B'' subunit beta isoform X4 [Mesoplodon densirostris]|uniref:serine/threonine-protein phosphatase 2A regulatory subunit B'' subunit beta isoform X4 n=1 Tax=Mesoplodon densirostris TaxID=48708 RepID=UPI0028DBC407|nr:serine/threonine-protein phosphatase 2A regulatory subunit B'' subunit beta isoform X4 [Mesoplodon densirostris]